MTLEEQRKLKSIKLPCNVKIGNTTFGKGCSIASIITKANKLHRDLDDIFKEYPQVLPFLLKK